MVPEISGMVQIRDPGQVPQLEEKPLTKRGRLQVLLDIVDGR
jgi:hypothetical protein